MGVFKSQVVVGVSAALAVTVLVPVLAPVARAVGRPLAKSLLKGGLMLYEMGREAVAVAGESVEDMVAEIRAEDAVPAAADSAHDAGPEGAAPPPEVRRSGMAAV
jgi:hypothetical protein